ncbi:MAG: FmdB family zinc ribbon protein [Thermoanaerobaculia bacterium]
MPLREFSCACGNRFEELVGAGARVECPRCGGRKLKRLLSTFAVSAAAGSSRTRDAGPGDSPTGCGTCGDPRGPGACGGE